jgi:hypothetical protein
MHCGLCASRGRFQHHFPRGLLLCPYRRQPSLGGAWRAGRRLDVQHLPAAATRGVRKHRVGTTSSLASCIGRIQHRGREDPQQPRRTHHQLGLSCRASSLRYAAAAAAAAVDQYGRAALAPCHRELPFGGARSRGGGGGGRGTRGWKPDPQPPFAAGHSRHSADNLHGNRQSAQAAGAEITVHLPQY